MESVPSKVEWDARVAEAAEALSVLFDWVAILDASGEIQKLLGTIPHAGHVQEVVQDLISEFGKCLEGHPLDFYRAWEVDGAPCLFKVRARRIPGYTDIVLAVARASREEQAAHDRATLAREFEFISANLRQGICRLDAEGKFIWVNQFLSNWLELPVTSLIGRTMADYLVAADGVPDFGSNIPAGSFDCDLFSETGLVRRGRLHVLPIQDELDRHTGTFVLVTDVTGEHAVRAKLVQEVQKMASLASLDPMTGLLNRRAFDDGYRQAMQYADQEPFGIVLLDLDNLKEINDSYGHEAGDAAILEFSKRLRASLRDSDWVARIGGDEFAAMSPGITRAALRDLTSRIEDNMRFELPWNGELLMVEASVGSAHSDEGVTAVLPAADAAMYAQKRLRQQARQRKSA